MKIYQNEPNDWRDLQIKVAKILSDSGFQCEIEKNVQTTRDTVNIDVYAYDDKNAPPIKILNECKYWSSAVPKSVIHSFRTVVSDYGANLGLIISKSGFQKGAYEAAVNSNIELVDWPEFENMFKVKWLKQRIRLISLETVHLKHYVSSVFLVFFKDHYNKLNKTELEHFNELNNKYFNYAYYSMDHNSLFDTTNEFNFTEFDNMVHAAEKEFSRSFSSYEEYYNFLLKKCTEGVDEFDKLFGEKLRVNF